MYVRAISTRFCRGRSTPAMRAIPLPLPLLVLLVRADDPDHPVAADHLALDADLLDRRPYFHRSIPLPPPHDAAPTRVEGSDLHHHHVSGPQTQQARLARHVRGHRGAP